MSFKFAFVLLPAAMLVSACSIDPKNYETAPVKVDTPAGAVTCQLYTKSLTTWDRAIAYPDRMSSKDADAICQKKGLEQKTAK